jgi:predicted enzyme related to lactoylglutathione lyase
LAIGWREKEFLMRSFILRAVLASIVLSFAGGSATAQTTFPYDHIHLNVPDTAAGANWYEKFFGGRRITEAPDRLMYGSTRLLFIKKEDAKPSAGAAVDHIGFSVADLDAKMKEFQAGGVKIVSPPRDVPGLFKLAFIEDPWGTRIEVVQDPECWACITSTCADRTRKKFSPGCKRNSAGNARS